MQKHSNIPLNEIDVSERKCVKPFLFYIRNGSAASEMNSTHTIYILYIQFADTKDLAFPVGNGQAFRP